MADVSKAQKLASARKKFQELKKEKKKNAEHKSVQQSTNATEEYVPSAPIPDITPSIPQEPSQLLNYFNNGVHSNAFQQPAAFFDNLSQPLKTVPELNNVGNYFTPDIAQNQSESVTQETTNFIEPQDFINDSKTSEDLADFQNFDTVRLDQDILQTSPLTNIENSRKITEKIMAELDNPTSDPVESQLELRNEELSLQLNQERLKVTELTDTVKEYQVRVSQLEAELRHREIKGVYENSEVDSLKEQLQYHTKTVEILVAEKTELIHNLSQCQTTLQGKNDECGELQGRLKTSRSRVADLEREIASLRQEKSHFDNAGREQIAELEEFKKNLQLLKQEKEELIEDLSEVREKLKSSSENNLVFQQQIAELSNQLSLTHVKLQQLMTGEVDESGDQLIQTKITLEKQIVDLTNSIKTLTKERDDSNIQYQQYAQQLNSQLNNMATRLEKLQHENETLQSQEDNRIKHIGELEKQLQNLQNDQVAFGVPKNNDELKGELNAALATILELKREIQELQEDSIKMTNERDLVLRELEGKTEGIRQLEELVEELKSSRPDNAKLLAVMESDKVAAARAVAQNTELKNQMDSMQEVFLKLNEDKVELTEKLTVEQRNNKDLLEKLQKTEIHLQTLADAIEIKDKELSYLRDNSVELNKQMIQTEQLTDRLRHYEAQGHSNNSLQNELQDAYVRITQLTEEIKQIKENKQTFNENDEIMELRKQLEEIQIRSKELGENHEEVTTDSNHNDQLDKEAAMRCLEEKFLKTMEEVANLTDEKQRLEHLVLQLQGETETIGEYVALYQHQRSLLKQKAIEKDQQLSQLASDREVMKAKLDKLNELVQKLVLEKGTVPSELLEQHFSNDNGQLCEEHAQIHNEINKITQNSYTIEPSSNGTGRDGTETAEEIIALLSEIKTSNLVQPSENIHPCPWCSGQLITV